jgi:hypothetical protein
MTGLGTGAGTPGGPPLRAGTVLAGVAAPVWKNRVLSRGQKHAQYRVNTALRHPSDAGLYPIRLEVAVGLREPTFNGLPTTSEHQRLARIEQALLGVVAGRAVLAGVVTELAWRSYMFYADTSDWMSGISPALEEAVGGGPVLVRCFQDPKWQVNRRLQRAAARSRALGWVALCLFPLCNGGLAWSADGPAWGIVGFVALVVGGVVIFRLRRKGTRWYLAHSTAMSALFTVLMGSLLLGVVLRLGRALGVPAWGPALASLVIGAAVTAAFWPAQRRFWRARQAPGNEARPG